jgi:hypothetical protein
LKRNYTVSVLFFRLDEASINLTVVKEQDNTIQYPEIGKNGKHCTTGKK